MCLCLCVLTRKKRKEKKRKERKRKKERKKERKEERKKEKGGGREEGRKETNFQNDAESQIFYFKFKALFYPHYWHLIGKGYRSTKNYKETLRFLGFLDINTELELDLIVSNFFLSLPDG